MTTNESRLNHTDALGTEPFDQHYGLGYQVSHSDWSPFPRVNRLRRVFLDRPYDIDVERGRLFTEAFRANEQESAKIRNALAFAHVLDHVTLYIYEDDLLVGEIAAPAKASPLYPEFSTAWIRDEILHHPFEEREHDQFYIRSDEDRREILELCDYWDGRTVADRIEASLDEEQTKGSETGKKIFQTNLYHYAGAGHLAIDYPHLMRVGFPGIRDEARRKQAALSKKDPEYPSKDEFYRAVIIMHEAAMRYTARYADLAGKLAAECKDPLRRAELLQIEDNCRTLAGGAPKTFWQALQLFQIATSLIQVEGNGHSISYGRMDQWLLPYYQKDLENGSLSKEFALELLEVQYVKLNNPTKLKDRGSMAVRNGRGFGGESLTIGGVDRDGLDATNDLTMLLLEASVHTRMMNPWVCVRMHEHTPYELLIKTVECIRAGYGHPKIFNDRTAIRAMMRKGCSEEEARDYCVVGCVEPDLPGKEYGWHDAAYVNAAKIIEMAINGGRCINCGPTCPRWERCGAKGRHLGPDTGSLKTFQTFEEVLQSVDAQFEYWADQMCSSLNLIDLAHRERKPVPYVSAFYEDCMQSGRDLTEGGAKYNGTGPQASGFATCADSLSSIRYLLFEQKVCTGEELLKALSDNWEGHDYLYALVNSTHVPHFGNDDDRADELFAWLFECYCRHISGRKNPRGGSFNPGVYSVNANVAMGLGTSASADGRKAGEAISDNMGPVHTARASHDTSGPTALTASVSKVDQSLATNGTLLNMKFPQEAVSGQEGRDNLAAFLRSYLEMGGMHVQFNIMSSETMRAAQKHPEDYRDMLVRVAGYSAYFVELGIPLQNDLIQRTELHF
ncbi:MAG: formate C-acetyltransferase/glycerol dehydratase family glycyl radical enzyme [Lachnospiraceae bacterium]|nr:formate C-acetyltransferase/glycerol dehydratase family glycyl radical enzyme [Lachnospiraceae bacterium]